MFGELTTRQIISFAEQGASVKEISDVLQVEEAGVKLVLQAHKQPSGNGDDADINDAELQLLRQHAFHLATNADDETLQGKMTRWLIERKRPSKRRNLEEEQMQHNVIVNINKAILGANGKFNELVNKYSSQPAEPQTPPNLNIQSEQEPIQTLEPALSNGQADSQDTTLF